MFLVILLSPLVFVACFALPFLGTICSREQHTKWIAFWLLQIVASWTVLPFLGLIFECEFLMLLKVMIALGLMFALNSSLIKTITELVDNVIGLVGAQKNNAEEQIAKVAKQYGLVN